MRSLSSYLLKFAVRLTGFQMTLLVLIGISTIFTIYNFVQGLDASPFFGTMGIRSTFDWQASLSSGPSQSALWLSMTILFLFVFAFSGRPLEGLKGETQ